MTALGQPTPEESAYERGFSHGLRFAADYTRPTREAATLADRILGGGIDMRSFIKGFAGGAAAVTLIIIAATFVGPASAHDITSAAADCSAGTMVVAGKDFEIPANSPVTVTGPGGYSQTFPVTTPDWTKTLPIGPNGTYTVDWPHSDGHSVTFTVGCSQPTAPPTPTPTRGAVPPEPTPVVTPSPSPSPTPTPVVSPSPTPVPTPTGSVVAATGTPKPTQTLPATDTE